MTRINWTWLSATPWVPPCSSTVVGSTAGTWVIDTQVILPLILHRASAVRSPSQTYQEKPQRGSCNRTGDVQTSGKCGWPGQKWSLVRRRWRERSQSSISRKVRKRRRQKIFLQIYWEMSKVKDLNYSKRKFRLGSLLNNKNDQTAEEIVWRGLRSSLQHIFIEQLNSLVLGVL